MRKVATLSTFALVFACATTAPAQAPPKPGPEHAKLKPLTGEFTAEVTMHIPGVGPQKSKGEYSANFDIGGLFLVSSYKGTMLGQEFHGRGLTGYDTFKKKYTGVWVDNMSPALYTIEGSFDSSGKVYTELMEGPDPASGKTMKMKMVTEIKDQDHFTMKMHGPGPDGKEMLMMEAAYTRKK